MARGCTHGATGASGLDAGRADLIVEIRRQMCIIMINHPRPPQRCDASPFMNSVDGAIAPRRGRPRKFAGPSRAVTLTLPDEVIDALAAVDADLSRAVVRVAQPEMAKRPHAPAELAPFGRRAVI